MFWLVLILVVIGVVFYIADKKMKAKFEDKFNPTDWDLPGSVDVPTEIKPQVMAPAATEKISYEKKLRSLAQDRSEIFKAVRTALAGEYTLLTNINAADVLGVVANNNSLVAQVAEKNIATKQFDFIICDNNSLTAVCAIVLSETIDSVLINACESVQLPIARFKVQMNYDSSLIRASIFQALGINDSTIVTNSVNYASSKSALDIVDVDATKEDIVTEKVMSSDGEDIKTESGIELKLCPNCSAVMLKRKAKNGVNAGQLFWLCSTYPTCRGMLPIK